MNMFGGLSLFLRRIPDSGKSMMEAHQGNITFAVGIMGNIKERVSGGIHFIPGEDAGHRLIKAWTVSERGNFWQSKHHQNVTFPGSLMIIESVLGTSTFPEADFRLEWLMIECWKFILTQRYCTPPPARALSRQAPSQTRRSWAEQRAAKQRGRYQLAQRSGRRGRRVLARTRRSLPTVQKDGWEVSGLGLGKANFPLPTEMRSSAGLLPNSHGPRTSGFGKRLYG